MKCEQCGKRVSEIGGLCVDCHIDSRLPSQVQDVYWVRIQNRSPISLDKNSDDMALVKALTMGKSAISSDKKTITLEVEGKTLLIPVAIKDLDELAKKSGAVIGKWLIYRDRAEIDEVWKTIAKSTFKGELGISAKAGTAMSGKKQHVICVYTGNYLDLKAVLRVRAKLRDLKFTEKLCYKPDIYTYLGIYYRTTSLSPCRYRN